MDCRSAWRLLVICFSLIPISDIPPLQRLLALGQNTLPSTLSASTQACTMTHFHNTECTLNPLHDLNKPFPHLLSPCRTKDHKHPQRQKSYILCRISISLSPSILPSPITIHHPKPSTRSSMSPGAVTPRAGHQPIIDPIQRIHLSSGCAPRSITRLSPQIEASSI